jgi:hypothetical protein
MWHLDWKGAREGYHFLNLDIYSDLSSLFITIALNLLCLRDDRQGGPSILVFRKF